MRVISKFKDYYDIGLAYGQDPKQVYVRKTQDIPALEESNHNYGKDWRRDSALLALSSYNIIRYGNNPISLNIPMAYVIFCGKMYFGLYVEDKWHWHFESFDKAMMNIKDKNVINYYVNDRNPFRTGTVREWYEKKYQSMREKSEKNLSSWQKINIENKSPIVLVHHSIYRERFNRAETRFKKDVCLKNYDFVSAVDPYTAYQEISMFMSNFIGINENPMIEVSDEDMAAMKGFNDKSFKHPIKLKDL